MNSSTSSSSTHLTFRLSRSIVRALSVCIFLLSLYHTLVSGGIVSPSDGINQWQANQIKVQRYVYQNNSNKMVLVGSSFASRINADYIGSNVVNLAMDGLSSQTGLEIVKNKKTKPSILLVEMNETIRKKSDERMIDDKAWVYYLRLYLPMFRQEYQPVSVLVDTIKGGNLGKSRKNEREIINPRIRQRMIEECLEEDNKGLDKELEKAVREEAELVRNQIEEIKKAGLRVVLFDLPHEPQIMNSIKRKEVRKLMLELFPANKFEWLPEPPARDWMTSDGLHLVKSSAREYALFLKEQLLKTTL